MAQVNQTVLHGRDRYEVDIDYDLDPELEAYFASNGWLVGSEKATITANLVDDEALDIEPENAGVFDTVLEVQDMKIATTTESI